MNNSILRRLGAAFTIAGAPRHASHPGTAPRQPRVTSFKPIEINPVAFKGL